MEIKKDCFGWSDKLEYCKVTTRKDCDKCGFYKPKGTECDTCPHKGQPTCRNCRNK